jgi:general secretion pathway protein D
MLLVTATPIYPGSAQSAPAAPGAAEPDTIRFRLDNVDLRAAVELLGQYLDRPLVVGAISGHPVTLTTPTAISRREVPGLLKAILAGQNYELVTDSLGPYRIEQRTAMGINNAGPAPADGAAIQLYDIRLNHARASDVAATVNALYGRGTAFGDRSAPQATTLSRELQQSRMSTGGDGPGIPDMPPPVGGSHNVGNLGSETMIIPDAGTNSLLIRATQQDFSLISAAVKKIDVRPLQVLIEVVIAEVHRDRSLAFGVDVSLPSTKLPHHPGTTVDAQQSGASNDLGDLLFHVVGIGGDRDLQATLRAAASRGDVTIVSRPTVIAANNEKAELLVGSQRPFVQVSRSLPTDAPSRDQVVEYKDVGTKLTVRPTISSDGYVTLQVTQEVNAATNEFAFDAPVISTRSVSTQLLLKNGQTVVIGGLTDRQHQVTQGGVPFLSAIPFVGGLFGHTSRETSETELFLFITPHLILTDADADSLTAPLQKRAGKDVH